MPHKAPNFEDQSTESGELFERSPHCTWCALHAFRLQQQERCNRGRQEPYDQGDSSSSTGEERTRMCSRKKTQKLEVRDSRSDSSDDESLSQKDGTVQCRWYRPDVQGKCSRLRNTCVCSRSEGKVKMTGTDDRCSRCTPLDSELPKICEEGKSGCDHEPETADGAQKNVRQIVMESRCPCLCAYLHFTDTVDTCTCVRRSPCGSVPDRDSKTDNVPDDRERSPSAPNDKNRFRCCFARYFSPFRKHSKRSRRDVNTSKPSPRSLQQKNSVAAGDIEIADTCCHKDLDGCGLCQVCCRNSEIMKNNVSRKPSKRESYQSANVQRHANTDTAPRKSTAVMGRDSCLKCRRDYCGLEYAEKVQSRVRCTCDCESRNKDLKKFRSSLHRICRALSGCKRSTCTCDCHEQQGEEKDNGNGTRVHREEVKRRRKGISRGSGEKKLLPKRGLLALKYEILRCKELDGNSNDTEGSSSVCQWNQRGCHRRKEPPEMEKRCSNTGARRSEGKLEKCWGAEKKKCTRNACRSKNNSHKTQDRTLLKANDVTEDKEMIANHRHPKEKVKQKRCSSRKNKLTNAQRLHERDQSERSADDSSEESELDAGKNMVRKEHEIKTNPKYSREEDNDTNDPILDPASAEVVKIGDRYYQAICHRTAHVNIMSFKNLKDHRETHRRGKGKKSPRIEVRLKYDTTSSDEDSSEAPVPCTGRLGDSACHPSKLEQRKSKKRKTARDKPVKKAVGSDTKEAKLISKKQHRVPTSTGVTDGHCGNSPTPPVTRKNMDEKEAEREDSSCESMACDYVERLPKAMTHPLPSPGKAESPVGWKSEGSPLKKTGVSARTLELKQMSDRWFSNDAKQWGTDKVETADDGDKSGTCDVRPFTASSSAS